MKNLLTVLKKSVLSIIAIVVLLVIQAFSELALPDFTSDIINVGIQQRGIEHAAPDMIRFSQLEAMAMLMSDDEKSAVYDCYYESEADYNNELGPIFRINEDISAEKYDELDRIFAKSVFIGLAVKKASENIPAEQLQAAMPEIIGAAREEYEKYDDSIVKQMAMSFTQSEYETLGVDLDKRQIDYITHAGVKMFVMALAIAICTVLVTLLAARMAASSSRDLRSMVFSNVINFSGYEFNKFSTASLITRCTNDIQQIQIVIVMVFRMVAYAPIIGIGAFIKVMHQGASMSWVIGVGVLSVMSVMAVLFACSMPKFKILQQLVDKVNLVSREILTGLPVIRAFSREEYEKERFDAANTELTRVNLFVNRIMVTMMPFMTVIMNGMSVLILWIGSKQVDAGNMQVGDITAFISYTMQIIMAFLMISMMSIFLPRALVSLRRIDEVINTEISIKEPEKSAKSDSSKRGYVEFRNVSFKYPGADENVLEDISFTAKPGETTAIIGSTGSGKSTLVNLIPKFYEANDGEILVNGVNVSSVTSHDLRESIGYVPQKAFLFSGTIASNISYGSSDSSDENIRSAAETAQATEFIESKLKKYDDDIAQGGTNVSGGQKQRLSIARAIAKNPDIYIFDDSFSALDYKTDSALRKALRQKTKDSTIIIVAQRISTVLNAEQIIVLDEGRVVGKGSHKELMQSCETYKQIAVSQLSKEELE